jgi:two-component sensor histidine kinase
MASVLVLRHNGAMDTVAESPPDLYITGELARRRVPAADYLREKRAIQELAAKMAERPDEVLPGFVELAMMLTDGVSAGLSILEPFPAPGVFRWRHLKGVLAKFEDATTPRDFSPCGITLDTNGPVLSLHPERFYSWISDADIVVPEVLLVPFFVSGSEPMGTLWIVADHVGHFHSDHARIATELASFVGIAFKMLRTERRLQIALEEQETLTKEMSHRIKNLFAVSNAMVRMALKSADSKEDMAQILTGRFHALASAHGLIRRSFGAEGTPAQAADVAELLRLVLNPHEGQLAGQQSRFVISGPPLTCSEHALNGIALVFHELATNALKYGALATEHGRIDVRWTINEKTVTFVWQEHGGPVVTGAPQSEGFGSRLLQATVEGQFQGMLSQNWDPDGLIVQIELRLASFAH